MVLLWYNICDIFLGLVVRSCKRWIPLVSWCATTMFNVRLSKTRSQNWEDMNYFFFISTENEIWLWEEITTPDIVIFRQNLILPSSQYIKSDKTIVSSYERLIGSRNVCYIKFHISSFKSFFLFWFMIFFSQDRSSRHYTIRMVTIHRLRSTTQTVTRQPEQ